MGAILERLKAFIDFKGITVASFEKSIGVSNASISKQLKTGKAIGTDKLEIILSRYSELSPTWLMTGEGDMIKNDSSINEHNSTLQIHPVATETRPRIPFDAAAGSLSLAVDSVSASECEQIPVIPTFPRYDFSIIARGDSMSPDFISGDELACAFVKESAFIQWGRAHVLDTAQGVVLKRIFNKQDNILCRSINHEYPDFEIPKTEIFHIAIVVGLIRHF